MSAAAAAGACSDEDPPSDVDGSALPDAATRADGALNDAARPPTPDAGPGDAATFDGAAADPASRDAAPDAARPVDASALDAALPGCPELGFIGECRGTVVRFCTRETNELREVDCARELPMTARGQCRFIDDEVGHFCAASLDRPCFTSGGALYCMGEAPGCVGDSNQTRCREGVGPCTAEDVDRCIGTIAVTECNAGQPGGFDCALLLGECADGIRCINIREGGSCGGPATCAEGLECVYDRDPSVGTCAQPG